MKVYARKLSETLPNRFFLNLGNFPCLLFSTVSINGRTDFIFRQNQLILWVSRELFRYLETYFCLCKTISQLSPHLNFHFSQSVIPYLSTIERIPRKYNDFKNVQLCTFGSAKSRKTKAIEKR